MDFNLDNFLSDDEDVTNPGNETVADDLTFSDQEEETEEGDEDEEHEEEPDDDGITFSMDDDDDAGQEEEPSGADEDPEHEPDPGADASSEQWQDLAKELGIEASNRSQFVDELKKLRRDLDDARTEATALRSGGQVSVQVARLEKLTKLSDEDLIRENLRNSGFDDDEISSEIEEMQEDGSLSGTARTMRIQIKAAIKNTIKNAAQQEAERKANTDKENARFYAGVEQTLSKTERFMGAKLGKNADEANRIRSKALKFYQSGDLFREMTSSPDTMAEFALWRTLKGNIESSLVSRGRNAGKKDVVLNKLGNAEQKGASHHQPRSDESEGFNVARFMAD
jgi:hypothetical protein